MILFYNKIIDVQIVLSAVFSILKHIHLLYINSLYWLSATVPLQCLFFRLDVQREYLYLQFEHVL